MESASAGVDEIMMDRCEQLAKLGLYWTSPNPMVGCVITQGNQIVSEGYHQKYGGPHAEVHAIQNLPERLNTSELTLYVSLEPCSHFGKTPPCASLITSTGFKRVVVGSLDPNPKVRGNGIKHIEQHGIPVSLLKRDFTRSNPHFHVYQTQHRPYVTLKWAETANGLMGRPLGSKESKKLSSSDVDVWVHQLRATHDAMLIGANTLTEDQPTLTNRLVPGKSPIPVVLSNRPVHAEIRALLNHHEQVYLYSSLEQEDQIEGLVHKTLDTRDVRTVLKDLADQGISSVLVEGGSRILDAFIRAQLWDEAHAIRTDEYWETGIKSPTMPGKVIENRLVGTQHISTSRPQ
jgi:diaminohydroxyphosphoribosylaminopyrimidine deaminase/5-amino-6-(5-phosphoribosylamino)uracil reductase